MAIPHAQAGEVIDVSPLGAALSSSQTTVLLKTAQLEVIRLVLPTGKEIAPHKARGAITVHCLEGKIEFSSNGEMRELSAGKLLFLNPSEVHSLRCIEAASVLVTLVLPATQEPASH